MDSRIRILYVIGSLDLGGSEKQLYLLLKYLDRQRFDPCVVSLSEGGYWVRPIRELGIEVISLKRSASFEIKRLTSLISIMKNTDPGIIHSYQPPANGYATLAAILGRSNGKLIISRRGLAADPRSDQLVRRGLDDLMYRTADAVVCNSRSLYQGLKERFDGKIKALVIPNGMEGLRPPEYFSDGSLLKSDLGLPADSLIVGTVGRLTPFKNHLLFMRVAAEVVQREPRVYFVIIGDGPMLGKLRSYSAELGIEKQVIFMGRQEQVPRWLPIFDLFFFPSINDHSGGEGLPNAVMEAMMCGLPCVVSNIGGTEELFKDGEAGYVVDPKDEEACLQRVFELLRNRPLREKMGKRGQEIMLHDYSAELMGRRFESLYDSVLAANPDRYLSKVQQILSHSRKSGILSYTDPS